MALEDEFLKTTLPSSRITTSWTRPNRACPMLEPKGDWIDSLSEGCIVLEGFRYVRGWLCWSSHGCDPWKIAGIFPQDSVGRITITIWSITQTLCKRWTRQRIYHVQFPKWSILVPLSHSAAMLCEDNKSSGSLHTSHTGIDWRSVQLKTLHWLSKSMPATARSAHVDIVQERQKFIS